MNNVYTLDNYRNKQEQRDESNSNNNKSSYDFNAITKRNKQNNDRMKADRTKKNKQTKRQYRIDK